jgi:TolB-like protein
MHRGKQDRTSRARSLRAGNGPLPLRPVRPLASVSLLMLFALFAILLAPVAVSAGPGPAMKIAVFPFGNLSEDMEAQRAVMPAVKDRLAEMGMALADEADVNRILFRDRQRDTSYVSLDVAREFGDELGVEAVFVGCVVSYSEEDSPQIGLTARLIDARTGRILWAGFESTKGTEFAGILGLGEIKTMDRLIPAVVDRLLGSLSSGPPPVQREQTYRIAVVPFKNNTEAVNAGTGVTYLALVGLFRSKLFEPLEYGEIREAMVRSRIPIKGELDYKTLELLSGELNADGVLLGTLESYPERRRAALPPEVEMTVRLLDAREKRMLWYDSLLMVGKKRIILNSWDQIWPADETAYQVISKLMKRMENLKWR